MTDISDKIDPKDPFYWTEVVKKDGTRGRVAPQDLDAVLGSGEYRLWNENRKVNVKQNRFDEGKTIDASDLYDYINKGYSYSAAKIDEYNTKQQELIELAKPKTPELTGLEKVIGLTSEAVSGATFGVSDLLARGIFELEGLARGEENFAKEQAEQLRLIRENLGTAGTVANVVGSLLTGGASLAAKGTTFGAKAALGAAEGILGGVSITAAREALEDPSVSIEDYVFSAGLGGVLGAGLGAASHAVSKLTDITKKKVSPLEMDLDGLKNHIKLNEDSLVTLTGKGVSFKDRSVPILKDNKMIGEAILSRNIDEGYHKGAVMGVSLEDIRFTKPVDDNIKLAVLSHLTDAFDSVSSPTKSIKDGGSKEAYNLIRQFGISHVTDTGEAWAQTTSKYIPDLIQGEDLGTAFRRLVIKALGKTPDPKENPADYELFQRVTDPKQGILGREVLEFLADKDVATNKVYNTFKEVDTIKDSIVEAYEKMRKGYAKHIDSTGVFALKESINDLNSSIDNKLKLLDNIAGDDVRHLKSLLQDLKVNVNASLTETSPERLWETLYEARKKFMSSYENADKTIKRVRGQTTRNIFNSTYSELKDLLVNEKVIGKINAEDWLKFDKLAEQSIDAFKKFDKLFKIKDGNGLVLSKDKIRRSWSKSLNPYSDDVLTEAKVSILNFVDGVNDILGSKGIDLNLPSKKDILQKLNALDEVRQVRKTAQILSKLNVNTARATAVETGATAVAGAASYSLGANLFGHFGGLASAASIPVISSAIRSISDPINLLRSAQNKTNSKLVTIARKTADIITNTTEKTKIAPRISRAALVSLLNLGAVNDYKDYIEKANNRFADLSKPNFIKYQVEHFPEDAQPILTQRLTSVAEYVYKNLPKAKPHQTVSLADVLKADKLLTSVASPMTALKFAALGDSDYLKHVKVLYPNIAQRFQTILAKELEGTDLLKVPVHKRVLVEQLLGSHPLTVSLGAAKLSQGVHLKRKQADKPSVPEQVGLVGDLIQDG